MTFCPSKKKTKPNQYAPVKGIHLCDDLAQTICPQTIWFQKSKICSICNWFLRATQSMIFCFFLYEKGLGQNLKIPTHHAPCPLHPLLLNQTMKKKEERRNPPLLYVTFPHKHTNLQDWKLYVEDHCIIFLNYQLIYGGIHL